MLRFAPTEAPDLNDPRLPLSFKDLNELEKKFHDFLLGDAEIFSLELLYFAMECLQYKHGYLRLH